MKDEVEKLRQQIYEISLRKINDIYFVPPGIDGSVGLTTDQLDQILNLFQTAQVEAVRAELKLIQQTGADNNLAGAVKWLIEDRLARLKEDK